MTRRNWLWTAVLALPLGIAGGLIYANTQVGSYVCPLTGELLPCAKCCPVNEPASQQSYTCPITGEEFPCPNCCPANEQK